MQRPTKRLGRGLDSLLSPTPILVDAPSSAAVEPPRATKPPSARSPSAVPAGSPGALESSPSGRVPAAPTRVTRPPSTPAVGEEGVVRTLPTTSLRPNPLQPRQTMDDASIQALARSVRQSGILQPIAVRVQNGDHQIIAGERRWRAARALGMETVPVILREATDEQMLELALVENIQREDLNPMDRARAYQDFCSRFGLKPDDVAQRVGEDRSTVTNYLRLLELPEGVRAMVAGGRLSMGHARCLLGIDDDRRRTALADAALQNQLSVRALEDIVRREKSRPAADIAAGAPTRAPRAAHLREMERAFEQAVRTKVSIQEGKKKGTGRIVIEYYSLDDFDRIAEQLGVRVE